MERKKKNHTRSLEGIKEPPTLEYERSIKFPNHRKIRELEDSLEFLSKKESDKEEIIFAIFNTAIGKNPKNPFGIVFHVKDFNYFPLDNLRKTVTDANDKKITKKIHPKSPNSLFRITLNGLRKLRKYRKTLVEITNVLPTNSRKRQSLELRLKIINEVLEKFKGF